MRKKEANPKWIGIENIYNICYNLNLTINQMKYDNDIARLNEYIDNPDIEGNNFFSKIKKPS